MARQQDAPLPPSLPPPSKKKGKGAPQLTEKAELNALKIPRLKKTPVSKFKSVNLADVISPQSLQKQKQKLTKIMDPVDLTRADILESTTDFGSLNLQFCLSFLKTQCRESDVTGLKFSGTDQLTDAVWYILAKWDLVFKEVTHVSLMGCYNLTNAGVRWMTKVFTGVQYCPDVVIVLLGLTSDTDPGLKDIADRYRNQVAKQLENKGRKLEGILDESMGRDQMQRRLHFFGQQHLVAGRRLYDTVESIIGSSNDVWNKGNDAPPRLISTWMNVENKDPKSTIQKLVADVKKSFNHHLFWYFTPFQEEMKAAIDALNNTKFKATSVKDIAKETSEKNEIWKSFASDSARVSSMVGKGQLLYFSDLSEACGISDYPFLQEVILKLQSPPSKANWRFFGTSRPCWTLKDLQQLIPNERERDLLLEVLESQGMILCLPRDAWCAELEDTRGEIWPEAVPDNQAQLNCLIAMLTYLNVDQPTLFFGVRLINCSEDELVTGQHPLIDILWGNFKLYRAILQDIVLQHGLYAYGVEGRISPKFQRSGSLVNLNLNLNQVRGYTCEQEMSPNYSPVVEIVPVRGAAFFIDIKM
ncbi:hypothetical protein MAR_013659 [Mya arenaria]|uniref:Uncharacterized protein n=1 Tax=Mya arenaria TaxID=6604 RepID=A0ABY7G0H5_MYAAR|nr:hypothetical protein MAR_013659 [Mya arenaria]